MKYTKRIRRSTEVHDYRIVKKFALLPIKSKKVNQDTQEYTWLESCFVVQQLIWNGYWRNRRVLTKDEFENSELSGVEIGKIGDSENRVIESFLTNGLFR